jgi:glyoxylase-like metal-dependent hydrolase (beta-lactamase superfamily II)
MVHIAPEIPDQVAQLGIDPQQITKLVILHAHFDHCGAVPYLRSQWPWMSVLGSRRAKELLATPKVIESIQSMNEALLQRVGLEGQAEELGLGFPGVEVDQVVEEGDAITLGDDRLEVLEVPGHSTCSIALYDPGQKALFASDATGIPMGDDVFTAANADFDRYEESLDRMRHLEVEVHVAEHFGARVGEEARRFLEQSAASARRMREALEEAIDRTGSAPQAAEEIVARLEPQLPEGFLPRDVISIVVGQMAKYIGKRRLPHNT